MGSFMRRFVRATKGMALGMTAVLLPVLLLIMVFVVDIGVAQIAQSRLESAVNQAAETGIMNLPDEIGASEIARSVVILSMADSGRFGTDLSVEVETTADTLVVSAQLETFSWFGVLAGRSSYQVAAEATRQLAP